MCCKRLRGSADDVDVRAMTERDIDCEEVTIEMQERRRLQQGLMPGARMEG